MKKRIVAMVMAGVMACAAAGCGSSSGSAPAETQAADGQEAQAAGGNGGQTVKIICPYGVGGTADAIARKYALVANNHSDYNFIVENMTGGDGFQAANWYTALAWHTATISERRIRPRWWILTAMTFTRWRMWMTERGSCMQRQALRWPRFWRSRKTAG